MLVIKAVVLFLLSHNLYADESQIIPITEDITNRVSNIEVIKVDEETKKKVSEIVNYTKTKAYKNKVDAYKEQIISGADIAINTTGKKANDELGKLILFISKSIPIRTLRNYARDLSAFKNATMVINGFVESGTYMKPTLMFINEILKVNPLCKGPECQLYPVTVEIDPLRFKRYSVNQVPALVHVPQSHYLEQYCNLDLLNLKREEVIVVGDASISYMLDLLGKETGREDIMLILDEIMYGG